MSPDVEWNDLTRQQQWLLVRLYGGGTLRKQDPQIIIGLRRLDLLQDQQLSDLGFRLCEQAVMLRGSDHLRPAARSLAGAL